MLGTVLAVGAYAQTPEGEAPAGGETKQVGLVSLILSNTDFVFYIIMTLSVIGLTLIIQGFIKNRRRSDAGSEHRADSRDD